MVSPSKYYRPLEDCSARALLARLRTWLVGSSLDPEASPAVVLGCIYLLVISLVDIFDYAFQHTLPLVVANSARAVIMLLILALLPGGRYLGSRLHHPRRWMFVLPALLAGLESVRSIGSVFRTHAVASAIIACIALTFAVRFPDYMCRWINPRRTRWFFILVFASFLLAHAAVSHNPFFAYPSIDAVKALSSGFNPYNVELDPDDTAFSNNGEERFEGYFAFGNTRVERFRGYKYGPLLPVIYFPSVMEVGNAGILISNGIILISTALIASALCWHVFAGNGNWAAALLLATPLVEWFVIVVQVNDLVAVLPICAAFLVWAKRPGLAGLLLGASASIKIMPAPIAMALLLPPALATTRRFLAGIAVGLTPMAVFAAINPAAFFNNVILFEIVRPSSPGSLLVDVPSKVIWSLHSGFGVIFLATAAAAVMRHWSIDYRLVAYVVLTIILLLVSHINMDNYWLWWIPLFIPLLCGGVARPSAPSGSFRPKMERTL
jgi:hypothetical protein